MHNLLWIAIVLAVAWLVLKFALAITSVGLHLLWVAALIMFAIWVFRLLTGGRGNPAP